MGTVLASIEQRVRETQQRHAVVFFRAPSLSAEQELCFYKCVSNVALDDVDGTLNLDLQLPGPLEASFDRLIWQLAARPLDVAVRMPGRDEAEPSRVESFAGHCSVASIHGYISGSRNLSTLRLRFNLEGWRERFVP